MTTQEILERLECEYEDEEILLADGLEDALIGVVEGWQSHGRVTVACYDYDLCAEALVRQGMTEEDAYEWLDFNTLGAYAGKTTPVFLHNWRREADRLEVVFEAEKKERGREHWTAPGRACAGVPVLFRQRFGHGA